MVRKDLKTLAQQATTESLFKTPNQQLRNLEQEWLDIAAKEELTPEYIHDLAKLGFTANELCHRFKLSLEEFNSRFKEFYDNGAFQYRKHVLEQQQKLINEGNVEMIKHVQKQLHDSSPDVIDDYMNPQQLAKALTKVLKHLKYLDDTTAEDSSK